MLNQLKTSRHGIKPAKFATGNAELYNKLVDRVRGNKPYGGVGLMFSDANSGQQSQEKYAPNFIDSINRLQTVMARIDQQSPD